MILSGQHPRKRNKLEVPKASNIWLPYVTLALAFLLQTIQWPGLSGYFAPEWVFMVLVYWILALPYRFGIYFALLVGLVKDVHEGSPLGLNGLCMALIAYVVLALYQRIRIYPPIQQAGAVAILLLGYLTLKLLLRSLIGDLPAPSWWALVPAFTSAILWPVIFLLLRSMRIRYRVR